MTEQTSNGERELKTCPFCGGAAELYNREDDTGWSNTDWVSCAGCGAQTCLHETEGQAITAWNTRHGEAIGALVELQEWVAQEQLELRPIDLDFRAKHTTLRRVRAKIRAALARKEVP